MTRTLDVVQAQLAALKDILRQIERRTGRVKFSTGGKDEPTRPSGVESLREYTMDRIAWLRHEERIMMGRLHEKV